MSKLRISTEKMASVSNVWLTEKRAKIDAIPQLASLIPDIEATHQALTLASNSPLPVNEQLRVMIQRLEELDDSHDHFFRAGYRMTQAQHALAIALQRPSLTATLERLQNQIYPRGLTGTTLKYEEQEGAALLVDKELDDATRSSLKTISCTLETGETITLLSCIEEHTKAAKEMGPLERQKKKLQEQEAAPKAADVPDARKARFAWVDVANAVERNAILAQRRGAATAEVVKEILSDLQSAEAQADREHAQRKEKEAKEKEATTPVAGKD